MPFLPSNASLLAFEAVARRRSFSLAATELHLTPPAISHKVARLEADLGLRLFDRNAHGVRLSSAGEQYLSRIAVPLAAIISATEDMKEGVENQLHVHATPSIAGLWLMPRLRTFTKAHPEIALKLTASPAHSDFALGNVDLDIRYGIPQWSDLVVKPLFLERIAPIASPDFIKEHRLKKPDQLLNVPLIQSNISVVQWSDWFASFSTLRAPESFPISFDRAHLTLDAATQGLGVALQSTTIAAAHLADKKLRLVFGSDLCISKEVHFAAYPATHAKRPPVQAFLSWLEIQTAQTKH